MSRGPIPSFFSPPTSYRCSPVRAVEPAAQVIMTDQVLVPAMNKKAAGSAASKKGWTNTFRDLLRTEGGIRTHEVAPTRFQRARSTGLCHLSKRPQAFQNLKADEPSTAMLQKPAALRCES